MLCLGAVLAAAMQIRCVDAAREAARLAARGDDRNATSTAQQLAPDRATVEFRTEGEHVVATVTAGLPVFPALRIRAEAVAAMEPESAS